MGNERGLFKVKAGRIVYCKLLKQKNEFSGSKGYRSFWENGRFVVKRRYERIKKKEKNVSCDVDVISENLVEGSGCKKFEKKNKNYRIKANEVKDRANAIFSLKRSKSCMGFLTISFPRNMNDDSIFRCFNTFLTRVRKVMNLKYYIWVTERQKNGTLHFHVIVNQFLNVRVINRYMSVAIDNELRKNHQENVNFDKLKYNGVDLKRCDNNIKKLSCYLTKYVSKSNVTFSRLAWHCSRAVSNLVTSYDTPFWAEMQSIFNSKFQVQKVWNSDFADILYISQNDSVKLIRLLGVVNNLIDEYKEEMGMVILKDTKEISVLKQLVMFEE